MKNYFIARARDNVYRYYIFTKALKRRKPKSLSKAESPMEIAYELLLERLKNGK
ncbi:MAG TPA: hypothetical protein GX390_01840 [Acholeplasmataceae bacterium]|jgi:hypothetical protein|nr:hypothetical protein [Acholeplasmataceae bacterium]